VTYRKVFYSFSQSLNGAFLKSSLRFAKKYVHSQNNSCKQHDTLDYMQKPVTYSKIEFKYLYQLTYHCYQNEKSLCHCSQTR